MNPTFVWMEAAERYATARASDTTQDAVQPESQNFESFTKSDAWNAALKLLAAAEREICLGYSEAVMSQTSAVVINGEGLHRHVGLVGMAAAYSSRKPTREPIDHAQAIALLESFPAEGNWLENGDQHVLVAKIMARLHEIAEEAPVMH